MYSVGPVDRSTRHRAERIYHATANKKGGLSAFRLVNQLPIQTVIDYLRLVEKCLLHAFLLKCKNISELDLFSLTGVCIVIERCFNLLISKPLKQFRLFLEAMNPKSVNFEYFNSRWATAMQVQAMSVRNKIGIYRSAFCAYLRDTSAEHCRWIHLW